MSAGSPRASPLEEERANLMRDIRSRVADIPIHLAHHTNMLVAVQQRVLLLPLSAHAARAAVGCLVGLEAGIAQDDNESLGVLVGWRNGVVLLGHQLRQRRRGE